MMQLTEAISVFTNPEAQPNDKIVLAATTIAAEIKVRPSLQHLFNLVPLNSYKIDENAPLPELVDDLGFFKAEIKTLEDVEQKIQQIIHESGETTIDGAYFHCTVGQDYTKTSISLETVAKKAPKIYAMLEPFLKRTACIGRITMRAKG